MSTPAEELDLIVDGGLSALDALRRAESDPSATGSRYRAVVVDPNEVRLQRMLSAEHFIFGVKTPFVGRREALEQLYNAVRDANTDRRLHVVEVVGDAGVGKTRLLAEMFTILDPIARGIEVLAVACTPSEDGVGGTLVAQLVRRKFDIQPSDREAVAREKILEAIEPLVEPRSLGAAARMLGYLAGLRASGPGADATPSDMDQFRKSAERTLLNLLARQTERSGLIIVVHRAQHLNERAAGVLGAMVEALSDAPVVMMLVGEAGASTELVRAAPTSVRIEVAPLDARDVERQVRGILRKVDGLPDDLVEAIVERSGGNPRLAEENIRLLIQRRAIKPSGDVWQLDADNIPARSTLAASVEAAVEARVSALAGRQRRLLEVASVFGYSFWLAGASVLARAAGLSTAPAGRPWLRDRVEEDVGAVYEQLTDEGLLVRRDQSTLDGQVEYSFAHDADRNRLYDELNGAERARMHRLAAQWLQGLSLDEPAPWYEVIGNHWDEGGRPGDAAAALLRAADSAQAGYAMDHAKTLYRRALALIDFDRAALLVRCLSGYGDLAVRTGDFHLARTIYGAKLEASLVSHELSEGGNAWLQLGRTHRSLGDYDKARSCFECAAEVFRRTNDISGAAATMDQMAKIVWLEGGEGAYDEALSYFAEALAARRREGRPGDIAETLTNIANIQIQRSQLEDAKEILREALSLRRQTGDQAGEATCQVGLGAVHYASGDLDGALQAWRAGLERAEFAGDRDLVGAFLNNIGEVLIERGDLDHAEATLAEAHEVTQETGDQRTLADVIRNQAALASERGDHAAALTAIDAAAAICESIGSRPALGQALRTRGIILSHSDRADEAKAAFDEALAVFREVGDAMERDRTRRAYAAHYRRQGDDAAAARLEP